MSELLIQNEASFRLIAFIVILASMAVLEFANPRRRLEIPRLLRWSNNFALVLVDTLVLRLIFPVLAVGMALIAEDKSLGLFHFLNLAGWAALILGFLVLDLTIYLQHVAFHTVPILWRLHRVHHADTEIDVSTGLRFHPLEIALSMVIKLALVATLGIPVIAVLIFEVVLNASSLFNHSNLRLPGSVDRGLRLFIVTPDMHRIHHSVKIQETNSNFGFNLPWWDKLFGTFRSEPEDGHEKMQLGIPAFRSQRDAWLDRLLIQPFLSAKQGSKQSASDDEQSNS